MLAILGAMPLVRLRSSCWRTCLRAAVAFAISALIALPRLAAAQEGGRTVWDGVYSEAQADRGRTAYARHCASCHAADLSGSLEARPLAGARFMQDWSEDTVDTLYTRIRNLMPFDDPATLADDIYLDSVAYILQFNGFPPGELDLDPQETLAPVIAAATEIAGIRQWLGRDEPDVRT